MSSKISHKKPLNQSFTTKKSGKIENTVQIASNPNRLDSITIKGATPTDTELQKIKDDLKSRSYNARKLAGKLLPSERVCTCGKRIIDKSENIKIQISDGRSHLSNVMSCGSVWSCPVCSYKISTKRSEEVKNLVSSRMDSDTCLMVTFTAPHHRFERCKDIKAAIVDSFRKMAKTRGYRALMEEYKYYGYIRALEITWGSANGWHPHLHVLYSFESIMLDDDIIEFKSKLFKLWQTRLNKDYGKSVSYNAFDVQAIDDDDGVSEYVTKWGYDKELTSGHTKKYGRAGRTPFQILRDLSNGESLNESQDKALFIEFSVAFKGARQITYGGKFREDRKLEKSDVELANEKQDGEVVINITPGLWKRITKNDIQFSILDIVNTWCYANDITDTFSYNQHSELIEWISDLLHSAEIIHDHDTDSITIF